MIAFDKIVGNILRKKLSTFINLIHISPTNVASVPNIASMAPLSNMFDRKQPIDIDTIAISSKSGNIHRASATRTCTAPKLMG